MLDDGCNDHRQRGNVETESNLLDWGKVDAPVAKGWVDDSVHDRDHDDEGDRVQVVDLVDVG